jgi:protein TonB
MDQRKSEKANLDKLRQVFLSFGLLIISGIIFSAFTYRTYDKNSYEFIVEIEEELAEIPQFVQQEEMLTLAPPPRKHKPLEIEIIDNDTDSKKEVFTEKDDDTDGLDDFDDLLGEQEPDEGLDAIPFYSTREMPYYPECSKLKGKARDECTKNNIRGRVQGAFVLPRIAIELGLRGTVKVRFAINKTGDIAHIEVVKGINEVLDEAAIKAVKKLPRAHPGMEMDKPVLTFYTVPIKINIR